VLRVELPTDGTGQVNVANFPATQAVSGTVTVTQATAANLNATIVGTGTFAVQAAQTGTWTVQQGTPPWTVQGDSASGAANAGNPVKAGGVFNTTQPTVTNAQTVDAQYTARGAALVATGVDTFTVAGSGTFTVAGTVTANQGGAPWSQNLTQVNSVALGSPSNYGTSPGAVSVPGVNAFVTNTVTVSGTVTANQGGAPWTVNPGSNSNFGVVATGAAVPANAVFEGVIAENVLPAAATIGNLTGMMGDKFGRPVVLPGTVRDLVGTQTTTISSTTETTIVTAGASGIFNDIFLLIVSNTAASGSDTRIDFRDTTAGTILFSLESRGGQMPVGFALAIPVPQTGAATNWTAQCASAVTDIRIYAAFAKNK
jgi:hypothetical protein